MFAKEALSFLHQIKQLDTSHDGSCFDDWGDDSGGGKWVQQWGSAPAAGTLKVATCNKLLGWYPAFAGRYTSAWGKEYGACKEREVHKPGDCAPHGPNHKWWTAPRSPAVPSRSLHSLLRTPEEEPMCPQPAPKLPCYPSRVVCGRLHSEDVADLPAGRDARARRCHGQRWCGPGGDAPLRHAHALRPRPCQGGLRPHTSPSSRPHPRPRSPPHPRPRSPPRPSPRSRPRPRPRLSLRSSLSPSPSPDPAKVISALRHPVDRLETSFWVHVHYPKKYGVSPAGLHACAA